MDSPEDKGQQPEQNTLGRQSRLRSDPSIKSIKREKSESGSKSSIPRAGKPAENSTFRLSRIENAMNVSINVPKKEFDALIVTTEAYKNVCVS